MLLVEDERDLRELVRSYLERAELTMVSADSGAEVLAVAAGASLAAALAAADVSSLAARQRQDLTNALAVASGAARDGNAAGHQLPCRRSPASSGR